MYSTFQQRTPGVNVKEISRKNGQQDSSWTRRRWRRQQQTAEWIRYHIQAVCGLFHWEPHYGTS